MLRKLAVAVLLVLVPVILVFTFAVLVVMIPVMLITHPIFRAFGLVGTIRGSGTLKLDKDSFRRRR